MNFTNKSASAPAAPLTVHFLRKISSKCSHTIMYAPLSHRFFAETGLVTGAALRFGLPADLLQILLMLMTVLNVGLNVHFAFIYVSTISMQSTNGVKICVFG